MADEASHSGRRAGAPAEWAAEPRCYLLIHSVAKPKNIGNIVRSAAAFGVHEVVLAGGKKHGMAGCACAERAQAGRGRARRDRVPGSLWHGQAPLFPRVPQAATRRAVFARPGSDDSGHRDRGRGEAGAGASVCAGHGLRHGKRGWLGCAERRATWGLAGRAGLRTRESGAGRWGVGGDSRPLSADGWAKHTHAHTHTDMETLTHVHMHTHASIHASVHVHSHACIHAPYGGSYTVPDSPCLPPPTNDRATGLRSKRRPRATDSCTFLTTERARLP